FLVVFLCFSIKLIKLYNTHFIVVPIGGKIALKSDNGKYVSRCNRCIKGGTSPDFLVINHNNPNSPNAQFTPELLSNGNYALKANTGEYLARCNRCSPSATATGNPDTVVVQGTKPASRPHAQWNVIPLPKR
ncbi:fascin domain-containing protein, partial [Dapis sp. BLCC M172]|uniref:fascin domain-containing protein n=1 Tax=Dapis sp. BLCC M172 TaxID=2975281 RepID=UPI003CF55F5C